MIIVKINYSNELKGGETLNESQIMLLLPTHLTYVSATAKL